MPNQLTKAPALLVVLVALVAFSCTEEVSTLLNVELMFPTEGENPLAEAQSMRVTVRAFTGEELVHTIPRPSSGSWSGSNSAFELGHVDFDPATISIEGLDSVGVVICEGESIAIPVVNGRPGRVIVFVQTRGTSGLAPGFEDGWLDHGAAYLEGGGILLAGGSESAPRRDTWVYALDWYDPIEMDDLDDRRSSLVGVAPLGGDAALLWGGAGGGDPVFLDPLTNRWEPIGNIPAGLTGDWPSPIWDSTPIGEVVTLLDRSLVVFSPGEPPTGEVLIPEIEEDITPDTVSTISNDLALLTGRGDVPALGIDLIRGSTFAVPPPSVSRTGHVAVGLSDRRVVLLGGEGTEGLVADIEVLDSTQEEWTVYEGVLDGLGRTGATASLLQDDRVVFAGGRDADGEISNDAVIIDFADRSSEPTISEVIELVEARVRHTATVLPMGVVMFVGGESDRGDPLESVEILRPSY